MWPMGLLLIIAFTKVIGVGMINVLLLKTAAQVSYVAPIISVIGKECEPTSPATPVLPRTPKTSTPMKQNIETAQSKHKHGLTSPSPQKVASEEKSKCFSESISDNSGEASNTIIIKRSKGKVALQFVTGTKKQIPVADKQDSPSELNTAQSDGEWSSDDCHLVH